jgi:hypothetical protein
MKALVPSSQRTLGPTLTFVGFPRVCRMSGNFTMDPSVRWDDEPRADAFAVGKLEVAGA